MLITGRAIEISTNKIVDLWQVTDDKRVKAGKLKLYNQRAELESTLNYLDIAIGNEFNYEWND